MSTKIHYSFIILFCLFVYGCSNSTPDNVKVLRYADGKIKSLEVYNLTGDSLIFIRSFSQDNLVDSEITYKNGFKNGAALYFKNGILDKEFQYRMDTLDGICTDYYLNGKPVSVEVYNKGKLTANSVYNKKGTLTGVNPFISISSKNDTIKLGETYIATVRYNCPRFVPDLLKIGIYKKDDKGNFTKIAEELDVDNCGKAQIELKPEKTGEYIYRGIASSFKFVEGYKDSVLSSNIIFFEGSTFVK